MNVTHNLDSLQLHQHVANLLQVSANVKAATTNYPNNSTSTQYGPDGVEIASVATIAYNGLTTTKAGVITGGKIQHKASDSSGKPLSSSELTFAANGQATSANTLINNRFSAGVCKCVTTDLSAVQWTAASTIHSGAVGISISHPVNNITQTQGHIVFDNEAIVGGTFTHLGSDDGKTINGFSEIDYKNTKTIGTKIIGGYCTISTKTPSQALKSSANVFFTALGRIDQIHTTNYDASSGQVKTQVLTQYTDMAFNARNELLNGTLRFQVTGVDGLLLSQTNVEFKDAVPQKSITSVYKKQKLTSTILTNFAGAQFNNDLKVINSKINIETRYNKNNLVSKTVIQRDEFGNPTIKTTDNINPANNKAFSTVVANYANVKFNHDNKAISGTICIKSTNLQTGTTTETEKVIPTLPAPVLNTPSPSAVSSTLGSLSSAVPTYQTSRTVVKNAAGQTTATKESITRADSTTLKTVITTVNQGKPVQTSISLYALDGVTLITNSILDLNNLSYNNTSNQITGSINMKSLFRGTILHAVSTIEY